VVQKVIPGGAADRAGCTAATSKPTWQYADCARRRFNRGHDGKRFRAIDGPFTVSPWLMLSMSDGDAGVVP